MLTIPENDNEDALKKARSGVCLHITRLRASSACKIRAAIVFVFAVVIIMRLSSQPQKQRRQNVVVDTKLAELGSKFPVKDEQTATIYSREARLPLPGNAERIQFPNKSVNPQDYLHICKEILLPVKTIMGGSSGRVVNLLNNVTVNDTIYTGEYQYYTVCIENEEYHHIVDVYLDLPQSKHGVGSDGQLYDADMYLSTHIAEPKLYDSTWLSAKKGSDHIRLHTNLRDWVQDSQILHIGVYGRSANPVHYSVRVEVRASKTKRHKGGQAADNLRGPSTLMNRALRFRPRDKT